MSREEEAEGLGKVFHGSRHQAGYMTDQDTISMIPSGFSQI